MGVDYSAVAGWGVAISAADLMKIHWPGSTDHWEELEELVESAPINGRMFGSEYSGSLWCAFLDPREGIVAGQLKELNEALGTSFQMKDVKFREEIYEW